MVCETYNTVGAAHRHIQVKTVGSGLEPNHHGYKTTGNMAPGMLPAKADRKVFAQQLGGFVQRNCRCAVHTRELLEH